MKISLHELQEIENIRTKEQNLIVLLSKNGQKSSFFDVDLQTILQEQGFGGEEGRFLEIKNFAGFKSVYFVGIDEKNLSSARAFKNELIFRLKKEKNIAIMQHAGQDTNFFTEFVKTFVLRGYGFNKYFTEKESNKGLSAETVKIFVKNKSECDLSAIEAQIGGIFVARDLMNEPSNVLTPEAYVEEIKKLEKLGVKVTILNREQMHKLGMNTLLAVGDGSNNPPYLAIMEWEGGTKGEKPLAFVGKGVCFDTGGICLKPAQGMEDMKFDMGGSAVVVGLMNVLATRKAASNVVGVVALVENTPSGKAIKPGDIVKSYRGKTVEIINTDAEGRLILADALWYVEKHFEPKMIVDIATLTGAITISLGAERAGIFSNNQDLIDKIFKIGEETGEKVWNLPLGEEYNKYLKSDFADLRNIAKGKGAGSIVAAKFLQQFVKESTPWCHMDIAGLDAMDNCFCIQSGNPFGIILLDNLVSSFE